jgi:hypothetical protein
MVNVNMGDYASKLALPILSSIYFSILVFSVIQRLSAIDFLLFILVLHKVFLNIGICTQ